MHLTQVPHFSTLEKFADRSGTLPIVRPRGFFNRIKFPSRILASVWIPLTFVRNDEYMLEQRIQFALVPFVSFGSKARIFQELT